MADDVNVSKKLESTATDQSTTEVPVRDADIEIKTSVVTDYGTSSQQGGLSTHRVSFLSQLMSEVMAEEENQRLEEVCSYIQGGHSKKFRQGCSCHFFGFEISQFVILFGCSK